MVRILNIKDKVPWIVDAAAYDTGIMLEEQQFNNVLYRERKRVERNGEHMVLLLLDVSELLEQEEGRDTVNSIASTVLSEIRETDVCGWVNQNHLVGIMFTGIPSVLIEQAAEKVKMKVLDKVSGSVGSAVVSSLKIKTIIFPDIEGIKDGIDLIDSATQLFYPEIFNNKSSKISNILKRTIDIIGSLLALVIFSPFFIAVPFLIKVTSPGPVFFKQERLGQFGKKFGFLKFRSMHVNNDDSIHRQFIKDFINNTVPGDDDQQVFKIKNDPRLTPIGAFLRKSSIDELPQFINVLKGEMSLVGPRPPIPYEVNNYGVWHWYRILARKPGITGLWQVYGRSLTTFDGMVRLDLRYIRHWSLWLDIKLLFATPMAVLRGKGAY